MSGTETLEKITVDSNGGTFVLTYDPAGAADPAAKITFADAIFKKYTIPFPSSDFLKETKQINFIASKAVGDGGIIYIDDIQFETIDLSSLTTKNILALPAAPATLSNLFVTVGGSASSPLLNGHLLIDDDTTTATTYNAKVTGPGSANTYAITAVDTATATFAKDGLKVKATGVKAGKTFAKFTSGATTIDETALPVYVSAADTDADKFIVFANTGATDFNGLLYTGYWGNLVYEKLATGEIKLTQNGAGGGGGGFQLDATASAVDLGTKGIKVTVKGSIAGKMRFWLTDANKKNSASVWVNGTTGVTTTETEYTISNANLLATAVAGAVGEAKNSEFDKNKSKRNKLWI